MACSKYRVKWAYCLELKTSRKNTILKVDNNEAY